MRITLVVKMKCTIFGRSFFESSFLRCYSQQNELTMGERMVNSVSLISATVNDDEGQLMLPLQDAQYLESSTLVLLLLPGLPAHIKALERGTPRP